MPSDYCFRANNLAAAVQKGLAAGLLVNVTLPDGTTGVRAAEGVSIDHVGPTPNNPSKHHVNVRTVEPLTAEQLALLPSLVVPVTPRRVWF